MSEAVRPINVDPRGEVIGAHGDRFLDRGNHAEIPAAATTARAKPPKVRRGPYSYLRLLFKSRNLLA